MCFDVKASLITQLSRAKRKGDAALIKKIEHKMVPQLDLPAHHSNGFNHHRFLVYGAANDMETPVVASWGLIPSWTTSKAQALALQNKTLNARGESMFSKPSFKAAAAQSRGIFYIDGFFEHHHIHTNKRPYYIYHKNNEPLALAILIETDSKIPHAETLNTFSIVTTKANTLLTHIHNNPKIAEPRMPLILNEGLEDIWLDHTLSKEEILKTVQPFNDTLLQAHTVKPIRGKNATGNIPDVINKFDYEATSENTQLSLF